ncbi:MAG: hypothetical protein HKN12_07205 [Gemmatimonadetes bacterium]|nr:hypothetical protein [Gemmatimonadota bacterium]
MPPAAHFLPLKPDILWARLLPQNHPTFVADACARAEESLRTRTAVPEGLYVVDFQTVGENHDATLILWRRITGDPHESWARHHARVDSLRAVGGT